MYVAGAFDVLHPGHLAFLKRARALGLCFKTLNIENSSSKFILSIGLGDFLIVGLHTDPVVNMYKGSNYPIMNLQERVLSVLACKYVSEVVIGAPYIVTKDLIEHFNISVVAHGSKTLVKIDPLTHEVNLYTSL